LEVNLANKITYPSLSSKRFVDFSSRYIKSKVIYYGDNNKVTFETYKRKNIKFSDNDRFMQINSSTEYRPDIVSYVSYGMSELWWYIMQANGIKDIYDFKSGITLRIPRNI